MANLFVLYKFKNYCITDKNKLKCEYITKWIVWNDLVFKQLCSFLSCWSYLPWLCWLLYLSPPFLNQRRFIQMKFKSLCAAISQGCRGFFYKGTNQVDPYQKESFGLRKKITNCVGKGRILTEIVHQNYPMVGNDRFGFRHHGIYMPALNEAKFQFTPSKTSSTERKLLLSPMDSSARALFSLPTRLLLPSK